MPVILALKRLRLYMEDVNKMLNKKPKRLRLEDCKIKASLGYIVRLCLKKK